MGPKSRFLTGALVLMGAQNPAINARFGPPYSTAPYNSMCTPHSTAVLPRGTLHIQNSHTKAVLQDAPKMRRVHIQNSHTKHTSACARARSPDAHSPPGLQCIVLKRDLLKWLILRNTTDKYCHRQNEL